MAVRVSRGRYVVEFQQGGSRVHRRLPPGVTKAQAQELETKLRRELFDGSTLDRRQELTLTAAIGLWLQSNRRKNQRQAESEARQWEPFVQGRMLRDAPEVAQEAVGLWRSRASTPDARTATARTRSAATRSATAMPSTINRRLALLKAVCKHAWKQGLTPDNLSGRISLLREDNKREVYLTRSQVQKLARSSPSREAASAILLLAYTGLRVSELLAMPAATSRQASLTVASSKTGKPRIVPVPEPVRGLLRALPLPLSYWQLRNAFDAAKAKAGLPHVRIHDLRHSTASWLINEGVDLYVVGKVLRHTSPQTTARYAHLTTATLEKAMRKLK